MPAQEYLQDLQVPKFIHCKNHKRCNCIQLRRQVPRSYVSSKWRLLALATGVSATRLRLPQRNLKCPLLQQLNYNNTNTPKKALNFPTKLFTEFMRRVRVSTSVYVCLVCSYCFCGFLCRRHSFDSFWLQGWQFVLPLPQFAALPSLLSFLCRFILSLPLLLAISLVYLQSLIFHLRSGNC